MSYETRLNGTIRLFGFHSGRSDTVLFPHPQKMELNFGERCLRCSDSLHLTVLQRSLIMGFRCLWVFSMNSGKNASPHVVLQPRQEPFEIWFEYVQEGLSDSITGYRWDSNDSTRDDMSMVGSDFVEPRLTVFIWYMYASIGSFVKELCILHQVFHQCSFPPPPPTKIKLHLTLPPANTSHNHDYIL